MRFQIQVKTLPQSIDDDDWGDVSYLAHHQVVVSTKVHKLDPSIPKLNWSMAKITILFFGTSTTTHKTQSKANARGWRHNNKAQQQHLRRNGPWHPRCPPPTTSWGTGSRGGSSESPRRPYGTYGQGEVRVMGEGDRFCHRIWHESLAMRLNKNR